MRYWNIVRTGDVSIGEVISHDKLATYEVNFDRCKIICGVFTLKGQKAIVLKAIVDEEGNILRDKLEAPVGDFIEEIGVSVYELFKGRIVDAWGELHQINVFYPEEYPGQYLEAIPGDGVFVAPKQGTLFRVDEAKNRAFAVSRKEVQDRIDQYKRLGIPNSFPEWLYCRVKGAKRRYDYIPLRVALGSNKFHLDPDYREEILSFIE